MILYHAVINFEWHGDLAGAFGLIIITAELAAELKFFRQENCKLRAA